MREIIKLTNVSKNFYQQNSELEVLQTLNLEGTKGEIIGILGPSGCGKSTILNIISGLIKPTSGDIEINGKIGYMFQKDHLLAWRTILNNILIGLEINKGKTEVHIDKAKKYLDKYGLMDFINSYPSELSGGMKQRIALIRTLMIEPDILLLDEPFSALDYQTRLSICNDVYKMIKDQNICSILVTHDIGEAISMCDKVLILSSRPAKIKKEYNFKQVFKDNQLPFDRRTNPLFNQYFQEIWNELRGIE